MLKSDPIFEQHDISSTWDFWALSGQLKFFCHHILRLVQLCCAILLFSIQHIHCVVVLLSILVTFSLLLVFCALRSIMYSEHSFLWPPEKVISVGVGQKRRPVTRSSSPSLSTPLSPSPSIYGALSKQYRHFNFAWCQWTMCKCVRWCR